MSKRAEILSLANSELQQKGVGSLSFRELATHLGIKSSSVHYYFPQKDDLIEAVIQEYSANTLAAVAERTEQLKAGRARLVALVDLIHENLANRQCTAGILAAESVQISQKARRLILEFFEKLANWIQNELTGMGKTPGEARMLSTVILTSVEGSLMLGSVQANPAYLQTLREFIVSL